MTSRRTAELAARTKLYNALRRIASYASPEKLRKTSEKTYGLQPDEAIEMAYSAAFRPATSQASPLCRVVGPNPHDGSWTIWRQKPGGKKDELELVTKAVAGQFKIALAACSGAGL